MDVEQLCAFMIRVYDIGRSVRFIDLSKAVKAYYLDRDGHEENIPRWTMRRQDDARIQIRKLVPQVVAVLERQHGVTVVRVNHKLARYIRHGGSPVRDDNYRTDAFYWSATALTGKGNWVSGFVAFPRESMPDHPLLSKPAERAVERVSNQIERTSEKIGDQVTRGVISPELRESLGARIGLAEERSQKHLDDNRQPQRIEHSE
jgi:hypothetical protein